MQLAGVRKVSDTDMGAEHDPSVVTAEPSIAASTPVTLVADKMRSFIDKVGNLDQEDSEEDSEEETDEGQYDNSPEDPTDTNEFDPNEWAYQSNPNGAGDGRGTVQPNATVESIANKLLEEYENFFFKENVDEMKSDTYFSAARGRLKQAAKEFDPIAKPRNQSPAYDSLKAKAEKLIKYAQLKAEKESEKNLDPTIPMSRVTAAKIQREYLIRYDIVNELCHLMIDLFKTFDIPYNSQIDTQIQNAQSYRDNNNLMYAYRFLNAAYDDILKTSASSGKQVRDKADALIDQAEEKYLSITEPNPNTDNSSKESEQVDELNPNMFKPIPI